MSRWSLIATIVMGVITLLGLAAASARNEEGVGLLAIVVGCALVAFRKPFAREIIRDRNQRSGYNLGEREEKFGRYLIVVGGLCCVAWGALMLLGIWEIRGWN